MARQVGKEPIQPTTIDWGPYLDGAEYEFGPDDYNGIEAEDDEAKIEKLRNAAFSAASRNGKQAVTRKVTLEAGRHRGRRGLLVQFFALGKKPSRQSARRVG